MPSHFGSCPPDRYKNRSMFIEFQFNATKYARLIRNRIRERKMCYGEKIALSNGSEVMIDRIEVVSSTVISKQPHIHLVWHGANQHAIPGQIIVLTQPVRLHVVSYSQLIVNDIAATNPIQQPQIDVVLHLSAFTNDKGKAFLKTEFNHIDFGPLSDQIPANVKSQIQSELTSVMPSGNTQINLGDLKDLMKGVDFKVSNAGLTANNSGQIFFLRVELNGASNPVNDWDNFYNSGLTDRRGGRDWAILLDQSLLKQSIKANITTTLEEKEDKFKKEGNVSVSYSASGPKFTVQFSGEVIDACTCLWGELDVDTDVTSTVKLSVPSANTLRTRVETSYDASDIDTLCCAMTAATFWPVVGIIYMSNEKINFGEYVLGWVGGPLGVLIASLVEAGSQGTSQYVGNLGGTCTKVNDTVVQCDDTLSFDSISFGAEFTATHINGIAHGPVLSGSMQVPADQGMPSIQNIVKSEFSWKLSGSCSKGYHPKLSAAIRFAKGFNPKTRLCGVSIDHDPALMFATMNVKNETNEVLIDINPLFVKDNYAANPYDCVVRMVTTGGIRVINLGQPEDMTDEQKNNFQLQGIKAKVNCIKAINKLPKALEVFWLVDPPPFDKVAQIWQIVVSGMKAGENAALIAGRGQILTSIQPNSHGAAHLSVLLDGKSVAEKLTLQVDGSAQTLNSRNARSLSVKQISLIEQASIPFGREPDFISFAGSFDKPVLELYRAGSLTTVDLTVPSRPKFLDTSILNTRISTGIVLQTRRFQAKPGRNSLELTAIGSDRKEKIRVTAKEKAYSGKLAGRPDMIVLHGPEKARFFEIGEREVTEFGFSASLPWYVLSARKRNLLARYDKASGEIKVYEVYKVAEE
jgi:hypothetical protein